MAGIVDPEESPFGTTIHGAERVRQRRPGREVIAARVREVANALIDGSVGLDVVDWIRQREADPASPFFVSEGREPLSYDQCRRMILRAKTLIASTVEEDRKQLLATHLARREGLYAKAVATGDHRTALSILQDEAELLGLYPPKRTDTGANGGALPALSAIVLSIIKAEGRYEQRRIGTDDNGGPQVPPRLSTLLLDPLQDSGK